MNKEQIKDEIILTVKNAIHYSSLGDYGVPLHDNDVNNVAEDVAEEIYNAGYRKTFTSDFASDTQKAYKEGYIKGIEETEAVKEFAEKLKERMGDRDYMGVKYKQGVFSENDIDELLKEYKHG